MDFKIGPPFRPPCGGWHTPAIVFLGPLYRHVRPSDLVNVGIYLNVTTTSPTPPSGFWIGGDIGQFTLIAGQVNSIINTWANTPGDVMNFAICYKSGFKNVCANRMWHGVTGFFDIVGCFDSYCTPWTGLFWESYQTSWPQTRYLSANINFTGTSERPVGNLPGQNLSIGSTVRLESDSEVNPFSGEIVLSGDFTGTVQTGNIDGVRDDTFVAGTGNWWDLCLGVYACGGVLRIPTGSESILQKSTDYQNDHGAILTASQFQAFLESCASTGGGAFTSGPTAFCTFSATEISFGLSYTSSIPNGANPSEPATLSLDFTCTISLSGANSAQSVLDDVYLLLGQWDLTDDHIYPWRGTGQLQTAPLVTRNEKAGEVSDLPFQIVGTMPDFTAPDVDVNGNEPFSDAWSPTYETTAWKDLGAWAWHWKDGYEFLWADALVQILDGSILGAPKPAGYQNAFDFKFTNYTWDGLEWNAVSHGMYLDAYKAQIGSDLPETATQWTDNFFSIGTPPGASLRYDDPTPVEQNGYDGLAHVNGLVAYKYAEILERWSSYSFARPCGVDKFNYDETQTFCAYNITGSGPGTTLTLTNWEGETPTIADTSGAWGGPCVGGFYAITYAAGVVTLGALLFAIPTGWTSAAGDDDTCFGFLRFSGCPSLAGRQAVTIAGTTATFAVAQPYFGIAASGTEHVDLYDASMNLVAGNVTGTRIGDGSFSVATAWANVAWVTIAGVKYYFDDNYPKGDFLYHSWLFDFRTNGEYNRIFGQAPPTSSITDCSGAVIPGPALNNTYASYEVGVGCLPFKPCCPGVVCFSPNGEAFQNGLTIAMPASFALDSQYGSRWQGVPQQVMDDPLWQKPHLPCDGTDPLLGDDFGGQDITFVQDDGTCEQNTADPESGLLTVYYAYPPQVEARISVPGNYGPLQNEAAPALPTGISITPDSPATYPVAPNPNYPPGYLGFDGNGFPLSWVGPWMLHERFCNSAGCRFPYTAPNCP